MNKNETIALQQARLSNLTFLESAKSSDKLEQILSTDNIRLLERYAYIVKDIPINNSKDISILDIGCGNGSFLSYLLDNGFMGKYIGVDISPELIIEARKTHPKYTFQLSNILIDSVEPADYVLACAVFNLNCGQDNEWIQDFIKKSYELSKIAFIYNAISDRVNYKSEKLFYIPPEISIKIASELSGQYHIYHGFPSHNYTVAIFKN